MPPKKQKTISNDTNKPKTARPTKRTRILSRQGPSYARLLVLSFTVRTAKSRTRTAQPYVEEINFNSNARNIASRELQSMRREIEHAVQKEGTKYNGDFLIKGTIIRGIERVTLENSRNVTTIPDISIVSDTAVASLAYLLSEAENDYFIASPPVEHGVRRRVHLLIGRYDRRVYVRKLVHSDKEPTEAIIWPQSMGQPIRCEWDEDQSAPGVPRFISCVNLGKDPNDDAIEESKKPIWSIISEWLPGVTLELIDRYLGMEHFPVVEAAGDDSLINSRPRTKKHFNLAMMSQIGSDLLKAVRLLKAEKKVHQDLTPANVLITQVGDERPSVTLLDFSTMRPIDTPENSCIPNDDALTKVKDAFGVSLCIADMAATRYAYQPGRASEIMADKKFVILERLQSEAQSRDAMSDYTRWIKGFEDVAESRISGGIDKMARIMPPTDHKYGQKQPPSEPLAFAKKYWTTGMSIATTPIDLFKIGPHRKVWIELETWQVLKQVSDIEW